MAQHPVRQPNPSCAAVRRTLDALGSVRKARAHGRCPLLLEHHDSGQLPPDRDADSQRARCRFRSVSGVSRAHRKLGAAALQTRRANPFGLEVAVTGLTAAGSRRHDSVGPRQQLPIALSKPNQDERVDPTRVPVSRRKPGEQRNSGPEHEPEQSEHEPDPTGSDHSTHHRHRDGRQDECTGDLADAREPTRLNELTEDADRGTCACAERELENCPPRPVDHAFVGA